MLGSSSTTRIFSFADIILPLFPNNCGSALIHRQQKRKGATAQCFAFNPDLSAVRLNQALGYRQAQTHSGSIAIHADEILKNLLMMLGRNARPGIDDADLDAVRPRQAEAPALFHGRDFRNAALPEMRPGSQDHVAPVGSVLQRVIEQVRGRLLHLLIIEFESWNRGIEMRFEFHSLALK